MKSSNSTKPVGTRMQGLYNFSKYHYAPSVVARRRWRRLKQSIFSISNKRFHGFYSEFNPRTVNIAFWSTFFIELSLAVFLFAVTFSSNSNLIKFGPLVTVLLDLFFATLKHLFDHKLPVLRNQIEFIEQDKFDHIGFGDHNEQGGDGEWRNEYLKRLRNLRTERNLIYLWKWIFILILIGLAGFRAYAYVTQAGITLSVAIGISPVFLMVILLLIVVVTTVLHATLTGYYFWYQRFIRKVGAESTEIESNGFSGGQAIKWTTIHEIKYGSQHPMSEFNKVNPPRLKYHEIAGTKHRIFVDEKDGNSAYFIQHGTLEDEHIKGLVNAVVSTEKEKVKERIALGFFLILVGQIQRIASEKEETGQNQTFANFNSYSDALRLKILELHTDYLTFLDVDAVGQAIGASTSIKDVKALNEILVTLEPNKAELIRKILVDSTNAKNSQ